MSAWDWSSFARAYWQQGPVSLSDTAPLDEAMLFDVAWRSSAPFRAGTRFRATPDVRFQWSGTYLAAPGELLPGGEDGSLDGYLQRVMADPKMPGFQLRVEQPLALDFAWWTALRDRLQGLWRIVGLPLAPAVVELAVGHGAALRSMISDTAHAELNWLVRGRMRFRLEDTRTGAVFRREAGAGRLLYWPAHYRLLESSFERAVLLRVRMPSDRHLPAALIKQALIESVQASRSLSGDRVPYLPVPPAARRRAAPRVAPLVETAQAMSALSMGSDLLRTLRIDWARRSSASALEPVPMPRAEIELPRELSLHMPCAEAVVRLRDGRDGWVWAVNGHVFGLRGAMAGRLLKRLRDGLPRRVIELCRGEDEASVLALLQRLYVLHAIHLADTGA